MTEHANNHGLHTDDGKIAHAHNPRYGLNIMIWLILISLTVMTVSVAGIDLGEYTLFVAMLIAAVKSSFVINYFMHIKFDDLLFKIFLILVILVLLVVFVLTGFDVFYR
ncbi:MAG: cytochrome C oxidase subunit IV family protein [Candidatus Kapabacteria bacterium]|jgi:cytochrome c oxidase subunit 4|nr:cytochrome C oxidase subunit IV family protein [Candidatus Kapabacteria bacterium]